MSILSDRLKKLELKLRGEREMTFLIYRANHGDSEAVRKSKEAGAVKRHEEDHGCELALDRVSFICLEFVAPKEAPSDEALNAKSGG